MKRLSIPHLLVWLLLAASLAMTAGLSIYRFFDHDEFEAIHTAWKIWRGERIYVDFIQHHHPFLHYLLTPLFSLFGSDTDVLIAGRLAMYGLWLVALALTYALGLELYRDHRIAAGATLFLSFFALYNDKMIEIRPDVPQSVLCLAGIYLAFRFFRTERLWSITASGLAFGVAVLFLQKAIVPLFALGAVMLVRLVSRRLSWRALFVFGASVLAPVLVYVLYLAATGMLGTFYFYNFTYNTLYYQLRGWELGKLLRNIETLYEVNAIILVLFVGSLLLPKTRREWEMLILVAGVLGFTLLTGRHNPQYYILAFPFIALLAARGFWHALGPRPILAVLVLLAIFYGPLYRNYRLLNYGTNAAQLAKIEYVLKVTEPEDYVYDGNIMFNLFRRDVDFIWYMAGPPYKAVETMRQLADYDYDIYARIRDLEPKVISSFGIPDMTHPVIAGHYVESDVYDDLYLRRN